MSVRMAQTELQTFIDHQFNGNDKVHANNYNNCADDDIDDTNDERQITMK